LTVSPLSLLLGIGSVSWSWVQHCISQFRLDQFLASISSNLCTLLQSTFSCVFCTIHELIFFFSSFLLLRFAVVWGPRALLLLPSHAPLALGCCAPFGLLRVSFIRPVVAFAYGFGLFRVPFHSDALSRRSPSAWQSPSAGTADPPANHTHTSLSHSLHSRHAAYSAALLHITSHPLRGLEDTTTLLHDT
jgi:hypothetical protein